MLSHYTHETLKSALEILGGVVVRSVDLATGEVLEPLPTNYRIGAAFQSVQLAQNDRASGAGGVGFAPLSTAHISTQNGGGEVVSPFVEWRDNASVLKVSKAEPQTRKGGGLRGVVKGFSVGSRRRLMQTIGGVRRDAPLPVFVTLTYPNLYPEPMQSKNHLKAFLMRLRRAYPEAGIVWKLEPQKRGAPHYHLLVWGVSVKELRRFVPTAWFEIAGGGDNLHLLWHEGKLKNKHCTQQVNSFNGVWSYASKYLGKTFEVAGWDSKQVGRFWGVIAPDNIPFGAVQTSEVSRAEAVQVMRYQRRFAKLKRRNYPSITVFCDANQWVEKLNIKMEVIT